MEDWVYEKIVNEAARLPNLKSFIAMLNGEPLCDKKIVERLKLASDRLSCYIQIYTNGSLLTKEILDQLKTLPRFLLSISLNGLNPETRKKLTGLDDWLHVCQMADYATKIGMHSRVTAVATPEITPDEIKGFVKAGGIPIQYQSWAGQMYPYTRKRWTSCTRALSYMTIMYDGTVNLCCFDPFAKVTFGNLKYQTIEEIWLSKKHLNLMMTHKEGRGNELPLCEACSEG
jgi:radical SAM protein with 4Fe4S-binding SPASM domain